LIIIVYLYDSIDILTIYSSFKALKSSVGLPDRLTKVKRCKEQLTNKEH